jgi:glycosyltransferase involved in cell wall biosynthesis
MNVSVILPSLNEERFIEPCLSSILEENPYEVIVVDGGSSDGTQKKASALGAKVLVCPKGLARQCNEGAKKATGEVLLFVACDCLLPSGWLCEINEYFTSPYVIAGAFRLNIQGRGLFFRATTLLGNLRARRVGMTLPDQGLVVKKEDFYAAGEMNEQSLIPFAELSFSLKPRGEWVWMKKSVRSSSRKWDTHGKMKVALYHQKTWRTFMQSRYRKDP